MDKYQSAKRFFETGNVKDYLHYKRCYENKKRLEMAYLHLDMNDFMDYL